MKLSDWIFKVWLLIIGVAFVAVYFLAAQNGRYIPLPGQDQDTNFSILDTRTGIIHGSVVDKGAIVHLDLPGGKLNSHTMDRTGVKAK